MIKEPLKIVPIQLKYLRSYWETVGAVMAEGKYLSRTENFPFEGTDLYVKGSLKSGIPFLVVVDPETDRAVGWADANRMEDQPDAGYLGMGLLDGARGQGHGKRLLLTLMERCREFGYTTMVLDVRASNERAIRLYKSLGYELIEVRKDDLTIGDVTEDVWRMSRPL